MTQRERRIELGEIVPPVQAAVPVNSAEAHRDTPEALRPYWAGAWLCVPLRARHIAQMGLQITTGALGRTTAACLHDRVFPYTSEGDCAAAVRAFAGVHGVAVRNGVWCLMIDCGRPFNWLPAGRAEEPLPIESALRSWLIRSVRGTAPYLSPHNPENWVIEHLGTEYPTRAEAVAGLRAALHALGPQPFRSARTAFRVGRRNPEDYSVFVGDQRSFTTPWQVRRYLQITAERMGLLVIDTQTELVVLPGDCEDALALMLPAVLGSATCSAGVTAPDLFQELDNPTHLAATKAAHQHVICRQFFSEDTRLESGDLLMEYIQPAAAYRGGEVRYVVPAHLPGVFRSREEADLAVHAWMDEWDRIEATQAEFRRMIERLMAAPNTAAEPVRAEDTAVEIASEFNAQVERAQGAPPGGDPQGREADLDRAVAAVPDSPPRYHFHDVEGLAATYRHLLDGDAFMSRLEVLVHSLQESLGVRSDMDRPRAGREMTIIYALEGCIVRSGEAVLPAITAPPHQSRQDYALTQAWLHTLWNRLQRERHAPYHLIPVVMRIGYNPYWTAPVLGGRPYTQADAQVELDRILAMETAGLLRWDPETMTMVTVMLSGESPEGQVVQPLGQGVGRFHATAQAIEDAMLAQAVGDDEDSN